MGVTTKKTTRGRQKIEMKAIEKEAARQVCFSKRRAGAFKKASELSVLCGAEIAVLAFSPSGKPFSYGHPSVESIVDRFFGGSAAAPAPPPRRPLAAVLVQALGRQENELQERLEAGRRRKAALEEVLQGLQSGPVGELLGADVEELGLPELDLLRSALEWARAEALSRAKQLAVEALQAPTGEVSAGGFAVSSVPAAASIAALPAPVPGLVDFSIDAAAAASIAALPAPVPGLVDFSIDAAAAASIAALPAPVPGLVDFSIDSAAAAAAAASSIAALPASVPGLVDFSIDSAASAAAASSIAALPAPVLALVDFSIDAAAAAAAANMAAVPAAAPSLMDSNFALQGYGYF